MALLARCSGVSTASAGNYVTAKRADATIAFNAFSPIVLANPYVGTGARVAATLYAVRATASAADLDAHAATGADTS